MHGARLLTTTATLLAAATMLTGCGGSQGPEPGSNLSSSSGRPASEDINGGNSLIDRVFGSYEAPSSVSSDTSILDSVNAGYSDVPGASTLDDTALGSLEMDDDPFDSAGTRTLDLGDSGLDTMSMESDPFSSIGAPSFDNAFTDAESRYGGNGGGALDDMSFDDPTMGGGMDDLTLDSGSDSGFTNVGMDDLSMDTGMDDLSMDTGIDDMSAGSGFDDDSLDTGMGW